MIHIILLLLITNRLRAVFLCFIPSDLNLSKIPEEIINLIASLEGSGLGIG